MSTDLKNKGVQHQPDATLNQSNPASGTKYTVLDTKGHKVKIISIAVKCIWTVQPTPLEIHLTIDGQALVFSQTNPASASWYIAFIDPSLSANGFGTSVETARRAFLIEGRSVKVEAEITGGTVSNLSVRVKWAKR